MRKLFKKLNVFSLLKKSKKKPESKKYDRLADIRQVKRDEKKLGTNIDFEINENETKLKYAEEKLQHLHSEEESLKKLIQKGGLNDTEKRNILKKIKHLRSQMSSVNRKIKILNDNISVLMDLSSKLEEMQAAEMKAVSTEHIDNIMLNYEERISEHKELILAGKLSLKNYTFYEEEEKKELLALEKEIMGTKEEKPAEKNRVPMEELVSKNNLMETE